MNIYEKIQKARVELQEKNLKKSGVNKYAGFSYFELSDFLPAVNKIFNNLKLFSKFDLNEENATLEIIDTEKEDSKVIFATSKTEAVLKGTSAIQQLGATHTYLKRYLYLNALEIAESDFVDATISKDKNSVKSQSNKKLQEKTKKTSDNKKNLTKEEKRERYIDYIVKKTRKYHQLINSYISVHGVKTVDKLSFEAIDELAHQIVKKEKEGA